MLKHCAITILSLTLTACSFSRVGPSNLVTDHAQYNWAINQSTDSQLLLNIVRLRYGDNPTFLKVGVISSGYENKRSLSGEFKVEQADPFKWLVTPRGSREYNEKPTTTYSVLSGQDYAKQMLTPFNLKTLALLNSTGWRIDRIMRTCIQRMNNVKHAATASGPTPTNVPDYKDFQELAQIFRDLELEDALFFFLEQEQGSQERKYVIKINKDKVKKTQLERFWDLLDLEHGTYKMYLVPSLSENHEKNEILVQTRSPAGLLYFLSHGVHVPEWDKAVGKAAQTIDENGFVFDWDLVMSNVIRIHSAPMECADASASVCYRGAKYYIDDSDTSSKATFALLQQLMALQSGCPDVPLLTLPISSP